MLFRSHGSRLRARRGAALGATRSGCLKEARVEGNRRFVPDDGCGWTASGAASRRGRPVSRFTNFAVKVLLAAITVPTIRDDRLSKRGAGRERTRWNELLIVRGGGRVRTGSAKFRQPTRLAATDAVQPLRAFSRRYEQMKMTIEQDKSRSPGLL